MEITNQIVILNPREIKPYHRNVRKNDTTVEKLVEIIPKVGFNVPIVIDKNNVIVKGHSRWKASIKLGMDRVPCVITNADEESIKLDRLTDNKVQEFSLWDDELLKSELTSLNLDFDFDLSAFNFKVEMPVLNFPNQSVQPIEYVPSVPTYDSIDQGDQERHAVSENYPHEVPQYEYREAEQYQEPQQPYITQTDIQKTVTVMQPEYDKCVCNKCGNVMFIRK
jgi:ParB-like nuclease domain